MEHLSLGSSERGEKKATSAAGPLFFLFAVSRHSSCLFSLFTSLTASLFKMGTRKPEKQESRNTRNQKDNKSSLSLKNGVLPGSLCGQNAHVLLKRSQRIFLLKFGSYSKGSSFILHFDCRGNGSVWRLLYIFDFFFCFLQPIGVLFDDGNHQDQKEAPDNYQSNAQ